MCEIDTYFKIYNCQNLDFTDKSLPDLEERPGYRIYFLNDYLSCPNLKKYGQMAVSILDNQNKLDCECLKSNPGQEVYPCPAGFNNDDHDGDTLKIVLGIVFSVIFCLIVATVIIYLKVRRRRAQRNGQYLSMQ